MCENKGSRFKFAAFSFLFLFFCTPFLFAAPAEEADPRQKAQEIEIKNQMQVNNKIEREPVSEATDYRQKLGQNIAVVEEEFYHNDLDSYVRYKPSADADGQPGKMSFVESAAEYSYTLKAFNQLPIEFALGAKYIGINNSTAIKFPSKLTGISFGAETTIPFFGVKDTYFTVGLAPTFATDNWNVVSSAFRLAQRYFFIYQANEKLTLIGGVSITPHENDPVMPVAGFIYKPNDKLTFNITTKQPEISYALNDKLTVFTQFDATMDEYKVTKDGVKNVVLEYNEMHAGTGLRYKVNKNIQGSLSVGGTFNRNVKYREGEGKAKVKDGMYTEFRIEITA